MNNIPIEGKLILAFLAGALAMEIDFILKLPKSGPMLVPNGCSQVSKDNILVIFCETKVR